MLNKLLQFVLFGFTMFAAGAPAVGESGGDADAAGAGDALGDSGDTGYGGGDSAEATVSAESSDDSEGAASGDADESDSGEADTHKPAVDETSDLKGAVSRRLQAFVKKSPALATALKDPGAKEFVDFVEATARRDMAYRELYPTVAEARQMREQFPNGIADVEQLLGEAQEISRLDTDFVTRNANGDYAGHPRIIQGMFEQDRDAALSLFRAIPKEWARLDRDSYNEVMGQIVGATFAQRGLPEYLGEMVEAAKEAKQDGLARELGKLANWVNGYLKEKPQPSEAAAAVTAHRIRPQEGRPRPVPAQLQRRIGPAAAVHHPQAPIHGIDAEDAGNLGAEETGDCAQGAGAHPPAPGKFARLHGEVKTRIQPGESGRVPETAESAVVLPLGAQQVCSSGALGRDAQPSQAEPGEDTRRRRACALEETRRNRRSSQAENRPVQGHRRAVEEERRHAVLDRRTTARPAPFLVAAT